MFPSTNNGNADPIDLPFFPDKSQHHLQLDQSLFNLPYDDFFHCQNGGVLEHYNSMIAESEKSKSTKCPKKDRHSKINTAQGPRDRRMRLSLKVAREFFDLQDKLGFDKASRTVEWLLIQARSAIKELTGTSPVNQSASPPSECEVIEEDEAVAVAAEETPKEAKTPPSNKGKKAKPSRKNAFNPQAKEMREKARAKARERTREKQLNKRIELQKANQINQLSCWSSDVNENGEDSVTQTRSISPAEAPATSQFATSESISDEAIGDWSPFSIFSHFYHTGFPQEQDEITDFPTMWE